MADISKFIEEIKGMSVIELNELVKGIEDEFGVSASAVLASTTPDVSDSKEEEKTEFDVMLEDVGPNKVNVIKAVKGITGLGLKESKAIVDNAPKVVKEKVSKEDAENFKTKLEEAGAKVTLK